LHSPIVVNHTLSKTNINSVSNSKSLTLTTPEFGIIKSHNNITRSFATQNSQAAVQPSGLTYLKGSPINFETEWGKKVFIIELWATWCGPCRTTIPHLTELQKNIKTKVLHLLVSVMKTLQLLKTL